MKMAKQVKRMVSEVNEALKFNHTKDEGDPVFSTVCWLLIKAGCYHGYNYYTADGRLSGGKNDTFDHLEIIIR